MMSLLMVIICLVSFLNLFAQVLVWQIEMLHTKDPKEQCAEENERAVPAPQWRERSSGEMLNHKYAAICAQFRKQYALNKISVNK